jgi:flagellar motor component MotA
MGVGINDEGAREIASRSRGTPRVAGRLLRRVRDFAEAEGSPVIDRLAAARALSRLEVDEAGLDSLDRRFLKALIENYGGGPVGMDTLAAAIAEARDAVEDVIDSAIKTQLHEMDEPQHMIQSLADALPALGIVAAVLGIIKTMGAINEPPEILGKMIGSALVGTFLGVLLAYGFAGPLGARLKQINTHDQQIFHSIKQVIIASLHGYPQPLVLEAARSGLPPAHRPKLTDLLDMMRGR